MQNAIRILEKWCVKHQLTVSAGKTELVLFTNRRKIPDFRKPKLFGQELELKSEVKYLGVILDRQLSFAEHIQNKIEKAQIAFKLCRRIF